MPREMVRVAVCDDDPLHGDALAMYVRSDPGMEVAGVFDSGIALLSKAPELAMDVVLMDVQMPQLDGPTTARRLAELRPDVRVLFLTAFPEKLPVGGILGGTAMGALAKGSRASTVVAAVRAAADGVTQLGPQFVSGSRVSQVEGRVRDLALSDREAGVLTRLAAGATNEEIAQGLHLSESTVKQTLSAVMRRARVRNRVELVLVLHGVASQPQCHP